ncbi:hypothetical protein F1559_004601 [Cyanidiococcus yangmingshanensis]|uniref:Alpha-soluble NSF attachment protein n=1 Tax=Cyanidiococcus yangmingshanensis TaxID=2690220 RepID=A0A7J7IQZ4_9RHOD|nr:hypothetical protein F1559_004601 [Cyanidiococcus yangmingshanensis]
MRLTSMLHAGESTFAAAESASKSVARLFGLSSASSKYEEAASYFQRAGKSFQTSEKSGRKRVRRTVAVRTATRASRTMNTRRRQHTSTQRTVLKKPEADPAAAVTALESAMSIHTERGRFGMAARLAKERAEILESIANETTTGGAAADERVAEAYQQAADLYLGEDARSHANACLVKVAEYKALAGEYSQAIQAFEQVAKLSLENSLLRYHAKDTLMRATICHLCASDEVGARRALQNYIQWDPSMAGSREERLLQELLEAVSTGDIDAFTQTVYDYDSISRLDPWKTSMLLRVKNQLRQAEEDLT